MQKKLSKIFVLVDLLIQEIDDPVKVPTKETKQIQDKARELQDMIIPVLNRFYSGGSISETVFFTTLQNKFNYIFNKEYGPK